MFPKADITTVPHKRLRNIIEVMFCCTAVYTIVNLQGHIDCPIDVVTHARIYAARNLASIRRLASSVVASRAFILSAPMGLDGPTSGSPDGRRTNWWHDDAHSTESALHLLVELVAITRSNACFAR